MVHPLEQSDIVRLAHEELFKVYLDREGLEAHPDVIEVGGRLAVVGARAEPSPWLQDDQTGLDEFKRDRLGREIE